MISFRFLAFIFCILNSVHVANLPVLIAALSIQKAFLRYRVYSRAFTENWQVILGWAPFYFPNLAFSSQPVSESVNLKTLTLVAGFYVTTPLPSTYLPVWLGNLIIRGQGTLMPGFKNVHISASLLVCWPKFCHPIVRDTVRILPAFVLFYFGILLGLRSFLFSPSWHVFS